MLQPCTGVVAVVIATQLEEVPVWGGSPQNPLPPRLLSGCIRHGSEICEGTIHRGKRKHRSLFTLVAVKTVAFVGSLCLWMNDESRRRSEKPAARPGRKRSITCSGAAWKPNRGMSESAGFLHSRRGGLLTVDHCITRR